MISDNFFPLTPSAEQLRSMPVEREHPDSSRMDLSGSMDRETLTGGRCGF